MKKLINLNEIFLESEIQLKIFFSLINNPKGLTRDSLSKKIGNAKTTIHNNLVKLQKRKILCGPEKNILIPYVKSYVVQLHYRKGRPCVIWYVPKLLRNTFFNLNIKEPIINYKVV